MRNEWIERAELPYGELKIIVADSKTGEIIRIEEGKNQIQDWAKHAVSHLQAGRLFSTWGNHGETVTDVGNIWIPHYKDGTDGTGSGDIVMSTPWTYAPALNGLIQVLSSSSEEPQNPSAPVGTPLYPFFPTKMRFGTGGLDANQIPKTDVQRSSKTLQAADPAYPYVLVERERVSNDPHILLSSSGNITNKVTFSCRIPGGGSGYPYNGKVLSEAGLFCDAALKVEDGTTVDNTSMRTGLMFAYRTFYGITKNESIDITFRWSFLW